MICFFPFVDWQAFLDPKARRDFASLEQTVLQERFAVQEVVEQAAAPRFFR